jgi:hypothetical protein
MKRTRELGHLDAGKETLAEFGLELLTLYAAPNLAEQTLKLYAILWDKHVLPRLGSYALRDLTPERIQRFRLELEAGGTGPASVRKSLTLLHGVLRRRWSGGGCPNARPYDLRHSFVSLLIHEGRSVVDVARQAGHAPTMTLETYAHVFDEFGPEDRLPAEEQIRRARGGDVPVLYLTPDSETAEQPAFGSPLRSAPSWNRTSDLLLRRQALYPLSYRRGMRTD